MKNIILLSILFAFSLSTKAQITLETSYPIAPLPLVKLEHSGYKWCTPLLNNSIITLYNLDHTLFKQIALPSLPSNATNYKISFVTETLFDTDSSDVEYALTFDNGGTLFNLINYFRVFDETGNVLFSKDSVAPLMSLPMQAGDNLYPSYINNTPSGAKMTLSTGILFFAPVTYVYSLPGMLECRSCDGIASGGLGWVDPNQQYGFSISPNPTNSFSLIKYELPDNVNDASLIVYDALGAEKKRFAVNRQSTQLMLPVSDFSSGTYFYALDIPGRKISAKKMVVIH